MVFTVGVVVIVLGTCIVQVERVEEDGSAISMCVTGDAGENENRNWISGLATSKLNELL